MVKWPNQTTKTNEIHIKTKEYFNSTTAIGRTIYMMKLHFIEKPIEGDVRPPVGL